jgi:hypothetical protein
MEPPPLRRNTGDSITTTRRNRKEEKTISFFFLNLRKKKIIVFLAVRPNGWMKQTRPRPRRHAQRAGRSGWGSVCDSTPYQLRHNWRTPKTQIKSI